MLPYLDRVQVHIRRAGKDLGDDFSSMSVVIDFRIVAAGCSNPGDSITMIPVIGMRIKTSIDYGNVNTSTCRSISRGQHFAMHAGCSRELCYVARYVQNGGAF